MIVLERLREVLKIAFQKENIYKKADMAKSLGYANSYFSEITNGKENLSDAFLKNISDKLNINQDWILTGKGDMFRCLDSLDEPTMKKQTFYGGEDEFEEVAEPRPPEEERLPRKLIPFYDDVSTIGGINQLGANMDAVTEPTEYIDAGDWFRDATAAIRHYGESMVEYPTGCILALKEVQDRDLIVPGRDYVVETSEYRVTKRIQKGNEPGYITAYSTNQETYKDGRLIHEPFDIPLRAVSHIYLVLGYVVKKNGETMLFNKR